MKMSENERMSCTNDKQKEVEIMKVCICMCIWQMLSQSSMVSVGISQLSCSVPNTNVMFHALSIIIRGHFDFNELENELECQK